jgi:hypothetical protein
LIDRTGIANAEEFEKRIVGMIMVADAQALAQPLDLAPLAPFLTNRDDGESSHNPCSQYVLPLLAER